MNLVYEIGRGSCAARRLASAVLLSFSLAIPFLACSGQPKAEIRLPEPINETTAEREGRLMVEDLLARGPAEFSTNSAVLMIQKPDRSWREVPIRFTISPAGSSWTTVYEAFPGTASPDAARLAIHHTPGRPTEYELLNSGQSGAKPRSLKGNETMVSFAGSDFWVADLGLEFFHWPIQRLLRTEMRRGQMCRVLESVNPAPAAGAYSRVVSWIDLDSGGIVHADAFDFSGAILKRFDPKSFEKVEGRWRLQEMEIRNTPGRSRSRIQFDNLYQAPK